MVSLGVVGRDLSSPASPLPFGPIFVSSFHWDKTNALFFFLNLKLLSVTSLPETRGLFCSSCCSSPASACRICLLRQRAARSGQMRLFIYLVG